MSKKLNKLTVEDALPLIAQGGIIAYPTEAVYGLGCDAFNQAAVESIRQLKGRENHKGFIILIADWSQLTSLIAPISDAQFSQIKATWPGFVTWILPAAPALPQWISGGQKTIAIRMSDHPIAKALAANTPIISTSANVSGQPPAITAQEVALQFPTGINGIVQGELGGHAMPSRIYDITNGARLR